MKIGMKLTDAEFKDFFNLHYTPLCLLTHRYVRDLKISKEIVEKLFTGVWQEGTLFESKEKVKMFFYRAVRGKSLDFIKGNKEFKFLPNKNLEVLQTKEFFLVETLTVQIMYKVKSALSSEHHQFFVLDMEGIGDKEIASKMKIPLDTVKEYREEVCKKLRILIEDH